MQTVIDVCAQKLRQGPRDVARRLFHGRGHTYPGFEHIVVTWYPPFFHIACYSEVPETEIQTLVDALISVASECEGIVVQHRAGRHTTTAVWYGDVPEEHLVNEAGLAYWVAPKKNQNTGLFLDMAHVRASLAPYMLGAKVLNLFAYTCAFSVSALAQGAKLVVNNDMNSNVLNVGKKNHQANDQDLRQVKMLGHNVFKSWKKIRGFGPYDVIIIDPPTNQRGSFNAEKNYPQILKRIPELAASGARVIACLNSPFLSQDFIENQMSRWCTGCELVHTYPAHEDFPEAFVDRGLKVQAYVYRK